MLYAVTVLDNMTSSVLQSVTSLELLVYISASSKYMLMAYQKMPLLFCNHTNTQIGLFQMISIHNILTTKLKHCRAMAQLKRKDLRYF